MEIRLCKQLRGLPLPETGSSASTQNSSWDRQRGLPRGSPTSTAGPLSASLPKRAVRVLMPRWIHPCLRTFNLQGWPPALLLPKPAAPPPAGLKGHLSEAFSDHQGNTTPQPHSFFLSVLVSFLAESSQAFSEVPC